MRILERLRGVRLLNCEDTKEASRVGLSCVGTYSDLANEQNYGRKLFPQMTSNEIGLLIHGARFVRFSS
ncbi:hypothetical protein Bra1253DRAFT_00044 [Bradyrhizobium sp. WSM1253]|nr:hypothetical protein Bra1253DRAFT_00044 [Bradyrhizobium sp. WSM1253]